jgi:hypothetical protein
MNGPNYANVPNTSGLAYLRGEVLLVSMALFWLRSGLIWNHLGALISFQHFYKELGMKSVVYSALEMLVCRSLVQPTRMRYWAGLRTGTPAPGYFLHRFSKKIPGSGCRRD